MRGMVLIACCGALSGGCGFVYKLEHRAIPDPDAGAQHPALDDDGRVSHYVALVSRDCENRFFPDGRWGSVVREAPAAYRACTREDPLTDGEYYTLDISPVVRGYGLTDRLHRSELTLFARAEGTSAASVRFPLGERSRADIVLVPMPYEDIQRRAAAGDVAGARAALLAHLEKPGSRWMRERIEDIYQYDDAVVSFHRLLIDDVHWIKRLWRLLEIDPPAPDHLPWGAAPPARDEELAALAPVPAADAPGGPAASAPAPAAPPAPVDPFALPPFAAPRAPAAPGAPVSRSEGTPTAPATSAAGGAPGGAPAEPPHGGTTSAAAPAEVPRAWGGGSAPPPR